MHYSPGSPFGFPSAPIFTSFIPGILSFPPYLSVFPETIGMTEAVGLPNGRAEADLAVLVGQVVPVAVLADPVVPAAVPVGPVVPAAVLVGPAEAAGDKNKVSFPETVGFPLKSSIFLVKISSENTYARG